MSLPKHTRTSKGTFRQESGNSRAKNLARDYPEFEKVHPETKLETLREKSGESSLNGVRKWLRENK